MTDDRIDWIANAHCATGVAYPNDVKLAIKEALREAARATAEQSDPKDAAVAIPDGWRFYSADFSINAKDQRCPGYVMLIRDPEGKAAWLSLSDEEREIIDLHVQGKGLTFEAAMADAYIRALKSQQDAAIESQRSGDGS